MLRLNIENQAGTTVSLTVTQHASRRHQVSVVASFYNKEGIRLKPGARAVAEVEVGGIDEADVLAFSSDVPSAMADVTKSWIGRDIEVTVRFTLPD